MSGISKKRVANIRWEINPRFQEGLTPLLEELGTPLGGYDKRVFYKDPNTTLFTVKTNRPGLPGELMVKIFRRGGVIRPLKSPLLREWKMAAEHERRGLPVAAHMARGVLRKRLLATEEYLVVECLTAHEPFDDFFRTTFRPELPGARPQDKRRVIKELASVIRKMHDRGISRPNIEPSNIMAAPRSGGGVGLVFKDLGSSCLSRWGKGISGKHRVLELARFHKSFSPLFSQGYRIRFFRDYLAPDELSAAEFQDMVKRIIDLSSELKRREEKQVEKAVMQRRDPYFWFDAGDQRVFLKKPLYQNSLLEVIKDLPQNRNARVKVKMLDGKPPVELLAIQCLGEDGFAGTRNNRARHAFLASVVLDHHGISHFPVMAALEKKRGHEGSIFTRVPGKGEYNLAEYLARRVADEFSGLPWDRKFIIRVARYLQALHEAGWHFPRPSGDDLWVRHTEEGAHEIRILNVQRLRRLKALNDRTLMRNVFDLWCVLPISYADGLMLAEEYMRFFRLLKGDKKQCMERFMEWQMEFVAPPQDAGQ